MEETTPTTEELIERFERSVIAAARAEAVEEHTRADLHQAWEERSKAEAELVARLRPPQGQRARGKLRGRTVYWVAPDGMLGWVNLADDPTARVSE